MHLVFCSSSGDPWPPFFIISVDCGGRACGLIEIGNSWLAEWFEGWGSEPSRVQYSARHTLWEKSIGQRIDQLVRGVPHREGRGVLQTGVESILGEDAVSNERWMRQHWQPCQ